MNQLSRSRRTLLKGAAAATIAPWAAHANAPWPAAPVKLVVLFPSWGNTELLVPILAKINTPHTHRALKHI